MLPTNQRAVRALCPFVFAFALWASPAAAFAQEETNAIAIDSPHQGSRPITLDAHLGFGFFGPNVNAGFRLGLPLVSNGFISNLNNAVYLSLGADFYYGRYRNDLNEVKWGPGVGIPVALHWEFYFNARWSAFGELGVNIYLPPSFLDDGELSDGAGAWLVAAVGGKLHMSEHLALVLRVGTPATFIGLSVLF